MKSRELINAADPFHEIVAPVKFVYYLSLFYKSETDENLVASYSD